MSARASAGAALLLALASCAVDEAREVARYREVLDAGAPRELPVVAAGAALGARDLMRIANARDEQLVGSGEAYLRSLVARRRAASAFLPDLDLAPRAFARDADGASPSNGLDVPLALTLDTSPRSDAAEVRRADAESERQLALLYAAQDGLWLDIARATYAVLRAERTAGVLENSLRVQDARVGEVHARRDVGFARPLDVSLIEAEAADTRVALADARRAAAEGRRLLEFLTNAPLDGVLLQADVDVPAEPPPVAASIRAALAARPDVRAAELAVDAAVAEAEVASGRYWPSLSVDLELLLARDSEPSEQDWSSFLELRLPLFSAGRIRADVRDALSRLREARAASARARRAAQRDCEIAHENLAASKVRVAELGVRLAAARDAFTQAESLYDTGFGTNLERLVAQDQQVAAELELESARLEAQERELERLGARGELFAWLGFARALPPARSEEEARAVAR